MGLGGGRGGGRVLALNPSSVRLCKFLSLPNARLFILKNIKMRPLQQNTGRIKSELVSVKRLAHRIRATGEGDGDDDR